MSVLVPLNGRFRALVASLSAVACLFVGLAASRAGAVPSKTPAVTWHTDGVVWAVERVGGAVILGGEFSQLVSDDGQTMARSNLAALDAATGEPLPWRADTNGSVLALVAAPDGAGVYVGGDFQTIGGKSRNRLASVSLADGAVGSLNHAAAGRVRGLHIAGGKLYVAGEFGTLGGLSRARVGAITLASGAVDPTFAPLVQGGSVRDIDTSPDGSRLYLAGTFTSVEAAPGTSYVAAVRTSDGVAIDWDAGLDQPLFDVLASGGEVYLAVGGVGWDNNRLQTHSAATANEINRYIADGDIQELELSGDVLYVGGHFVQLFGGVPRFQLAAIDTRDGEVLGFNPNIETKYGVWDIAAGPEGLWIAGEFTKVGGQDRRGVALLRGNNGGLPDDEALVQRSHWWKYSDKGAAPTAGTTWTTLGYDDAGWSEARAKLGYGAAAVNRTTEPVQTLYTRRVFDVADPADFVSLEIRHLADDGAVIYLNGVEVVRDNLPAGALSYTSRASSSRFSEVDAHSYRLSTLGVDNLRAGQNVIAVEIHNASPDSDDLRFGLELLARRGAAPPPAVGPPATCTTSVTGQDVTVSWASVGAATRYIVYRNPDNTSDFKAGETAAPGTTLLDSGVRTNATFSYKVIAIDADGTRSTKRVCAPPVNTAVTPIQGIQAPTSCTAVVDGASIRIDWPEVAGADKYYVYRSRDGGADAWAGKTVAPASDYTDAKAWVGPSFGYLVASVDPRGTKSTKRACTPATVTLTGAPPPAAITAPTTCTTSVTGDDVTVSWGSVPSAVRYTVYRNPDGVADYWAGTETGTELVDTGVRAGPTFTYKVIAIDAGGTKSAKRTCDPPVQIGATPPPPPPDDIQPPASCSTTLAGNNITVTWDPVADADKYYVYRSLDGAADSWVAKAVPPAATHVDANRPAGSYTHRVVAVDTKGKKSEKTTCSPNRTIAAAGTPAPATCSATANGADVNISWDGVQGADRYTINRNVDGGGDRWLATERSTSRLDAAVPTGVDLVYKVLAIAADGSKSAKTTCSPTVVVNPAPVRPTTPPTCSVRAQGTGVLVSWSSSANHDGYRVFRSVDGGTDQRVAVKGPNDVNHTDGSPPTDVGLTYKVQATSDGGTPSSKRNCSGTVTIDSDPCAGLETELFDGTSYRTSLASYGVGDHVMAAALQDRATSIRVPTGLRVELYDFNDFRGSFGTVTVSIADLRLRGISNDIEALRVTCTL